MLTKFAVTAVLLVSTVLASEAPVKIRIRMAGMKGVKRDASHIANYYLPSHYGGGVGSGGGGYSGGHGGQQLQVLDIKLPQAGGHYIPSYAIPAKSYESTAHNFPMHTPQFSHVQQQYVLSGGGHGGGFDELSKLLGGHGSSAGQISYGGAGLSAGGHGSSAGQISYGGAGLSAGGHGSSVGQISYGGAAFGGHGASAGQISSLSAGGHGIAAAPAYSYSTQSFGGGHQAAALSGGHGGFSLGSLPLSSGAEASKTGPLSFTSEASQGQQQQQQQGSAFSGHQFGFVAGGHGQGASQLSYAPQAQALTSSQGQMSTPVYAVGIKGLGHYATGGHGFSLGQSFGGLSLGGHGASLGGGFGGSQGAGGHGNYILDTSALQGLNIGNVGGKYVIMSKPSALTYGQSYAQQSPKYTIPASYSSASSSGGYKSSAPFRPSVFLGATQESVSEYGQDHYGQAQSGGASAGGYSTGQEYKFVSPTAASYSSGH